MGKDTKNIKSNNNKSNPPPPPSPIKPKPVFETFSKKEGKNKEKR